ncbi:hypothetical protein [Bradyrhizobium sp. USDA 4470]
MKQKEDEMMHEMIETNRESEAAPTEIGETQAREYLDKIEGERPSIRALATEWGWHRSRVERFLKKIDGADEGTPTATERRTMLVAGLEDFDRRFPPETAEKVVDNAVASGKVSLAPPQEDDGVDFSWSDSSSIVIREQLETAAFINMAGELVIKQRRWLDDDQTLFIAKHCIAEFIDKLTEVVGIPSVPSRGR